MKRYLDTFFRYWLIVLLPIIVLPMVEGMMLRKPKPQGYASMNIYVETSAINPDTSTWTSPAQIEVTSINQWLQSPSFCLTVAKASPLYAHLLQSAIDPLGLASSDLGSHISISTKGDNLVTITYASQNPQLAMQVVKGVLDTATAKSQVLKTKTSDTIVNYYQFQLQTAQLQERTSAQKLKSYMQDHGINASNLSDQLGSDSTLASLFQQNQADQANVTSLNNKLQSYLLQANIPSSVVNQTGYFVADPPSYAWVSNSRKKELMDLGIALALGLLLAGAFMVLMTALDRSLRWPEEIPAMLELPVLAIVPHGPTLSPRPAGSAGTGSPPVQSTKARGVSAS